MRIAARGWLASPPPSRGGRDHVAARRRRGHRGAGRRLGRRRLRAPSRCRRAPSMPALNAANIHDAAALTRRFGPRSTSLSPRPRRIALVLPDTVAKVSLVRFEKVPGEGAGSRSADPLAGAQGGAVPDRGRAGLVGPGRRARRRRPRVRRHAGAARRHRRVRAGVRSGRRARRRRRSGELQPDQRRAGGDGAGTPGDWLLVHVGADYATLAVVRGRRPHVLPEPQRGRRRRSSPISCTRRRCTTRIASAAAASRASCWRAPRCAGRTRPSWIRRQLEERLGIEGRTARLPQRGADSRSDRRGAGAARCAGAGARRLLRERSRDDRPKLPVRVQDDASAPHQSLHAAVLQRARRPRCCIALAGARSSWRSRCSTSSSRRRCRGSNTELSTRVGARRAEGGAADARSGADPRGHRPEGAGRRRGCGARGERADRPADVLVDGVLQSARGDAAAGRDARRRCVPAVDRRCDARQHDRARRTPRTSTSSSRSSRRPARSRRSSRDRWTRLTRG